MWRPLFGCLLIAYLPGALLFRCPIADRWRRAGLPAEERVFWGVIISIAVSVAVGFGLAWLDSYRIERLLLINGVLSIVIAGVYRQRLRLGGVASLPGKTAWAPVVLIGLGLWLYFPPSEYVMGGKDPGVYMNQGIQIAQRGSLVTRDALIASIPPPSRDLFLSRRDGEAHYGLRFMGYFVTDLDTGSVVGQFPHLFPVSIAIGYGLDGLTGARRVIGVWAILGVLALYFVSARLTGSVAAFAGAALLSVHVAQVWFSRYPNSELVLQAMLLAALLAYARAHVDDDRFFGPVSATLLGLSVFARFPAVLALVAVGLATLAGTFDGRRPRASFVLPLMLLLGLAGLYYGTTQTPYAAQPLGFVRNLTPLQIGAIVLGMAGVVAVAAAARSEAVRVHARAWLPAVLIVTVLASAIYAYYFRTPAGRLAPHDAFALRTYASYYLSPYGLAAALIGFAIVVRRSFWRAPALMLTTVLFAFFFFYKIRVVPEHFWMARRFLPVILPMSLLLVGAAAFSGIRHTLPATRRAAWSLRGSTSTCTSASWATSPPRRTSPHIRSRFRPTWRPRWRNAQI